MGADPVLSILGTLVTLITGIIPLTVWALKVRSRNRERKRKQEAKFRAEFDALKQMVYTAWKFQLRRGKAEGIREKLVSPTCQIEHGSHMILGERVRDAFAGIIDRIKMSYRTCWTHLDDHELSLAIEELYGEEISAHVCVPLGIHDGFCLEAAIVLCKEED